MPQPSPQVTAAEICRIAGVTRATVSNWRRRHGRFPPRAAALKASRSTTWAGGAYQTPAELADLMARSHRQGQARSWIRRAAAARC